MKNIFEKKQIFALSLIALIGTIVAFVLKNASYAAPLSTTMKDYSNYPTSIPVSYSYSTIVYNANTEFVDESNNANGWTTVAGVRVPKYLHQRSGKIQVLIKNSAMDANGNPLNVRITADNITPWSEASTGVYIAFLPEILISDNQLAPTPSNNTSHPLTTGEPILFALNADRAECDFTITYLNQDGTVATQINNVLSSYYDIDVPGNVSGAFLNGTEGFKPLTGNNTIYYNKNQVTHGANYLVSIVESDGGIGIGSYVQGNYVNIMDANSPLFQTTAVVHSTSVGGVYKIHYGGTGCGIAYMFISPTKFEEPTPTKTVLQGSGPYYLNNSFTYRISRYAPNNYFASAFGLNQAYGATLFPTNTLYDRFEITDTLENYLTINTNGIKVYNESGTDVTSYFNVQVSGKTVTASAKSNILSSGSFYGHFYKLDIPVTFATYKAGTTISNVAQVNSKIVNSSLVQQNTPNVDVSIKYKVVSRHFLANTTPNEQSLNNPILVSRTNTKLCDDIAINNSANHGASFTTNPCSTLTTATSQYRFREILVNGMDKNNLNITPALKATWNADGTGGANSNGVYTNTVQGNLTDSSGIVYIDYYYEMKPAKVTVHHYKKGTTEEICPAETSVLPYNTAYEKNKCSNETSLGNYIYAYVVSNDSNATINDPLGKVTGNVKGNIEITFYYELTTVDANPKKEAPTLFHSRNEAFNYKITDTVKIKDYRGDATITVTDKLEYEIDTTRSNLAGGTYNNDNKTITWTIPWNNINTNGQNNDTVTKDISIDFTVYYNNVPSDVEVITNSVVENVDTAKVDKETNTYADTQIDLYTLIVHHYKEGTTQELCPTTTEILDEGTSYTKTTCDLDEYDFVEVKKDGTVLEDNPGTVTDNINGDTTLDFIYRKKDSTLETVITKTGPDELTSVSQEVTYDIHYEGHVVDYRGDGLITITDTLPYKIDTSKSDLDGGEYDGEYKIVWQVNWNGIDTYNGENDTITVDKKIKVVFSDLNVDDKTMTNGVEAKTTLDEKTDLVLATKDTDIKLPGIIIVHHYLHGTTEKLFDDDIAIGLVHEKYHAQPKDKDGYVVVTRPEYEDVEFTIDEQELVYTYEKLKFDIVTEVIGGGGDIVGDEKISSGDDSTIDYIVITPDDGYEIQRVVIDGEEIEVTNKNKMIIDNFKNVRENHLVQVQFTEKPIKVPITGSNTKLIPIAIIAIILGIVIAIKTGYLSKVFKKSL